jgi:hypothetical protein
MSLIEIQRLLDAWRAAERALDSGDPGLPNQATRVENVRRAREAYLAAMRVRAQTYGYAAGSRTIHEDIQDLREAEARRAQSGPGTPEYEQAARDLQAAIDRMVIQVIEDESPSR